ncbi:MAG: 5-formyltetrahydrofolate cyclo-ligase [Balneolaceae bacterium]
MVNLKENKKQIRNHNLEIRSSLTSREYMEASADIHKLLTTTDAFAGATIIHTYASMEKNREVNTFPLMNAILRAGKKLVVPKINTDGTLNHQVIHSTGQLKLNSWGVPEPADGKPLDPAKIQLIIVPMVASDYLKNRIGYGKGFYDRFLKGLNAQRVGLCFSFNLSWSTLPAESFDQKMDFIVTEKQIIN